MITAHPRRRRGDGFGRGRPGHSSAEAMTQQFRRLTSSIALPTIAVASVGMLAAESA